MDREDGSKLRPPNLVVGCFQHPNATLIEDYRAGDVICSQCGLVVGDRIIDVSAEWRTPDNSRVGPAHHDLDPSTTLSLLETCIESASASTANALDYRRLNKDVRVVNRLSKRTDRVLLTIQKEIGDISSRLSLASCVTNGALALAKVVVETEGFRVNPGWPCACLYVACRQQGGAQKSFKLLAQSCGTKESHIRKCFKWIHKHTTVELGRITGGDLIPSLCANLGVGFEVEKLATHISKMLVAKELIMGRHPATVAGFAVYVAARQLTEKNAVEKQISFEDISSVAIIAASTIKQMYKSLESKLHQLLPIDDNPAELKIK